MDALLRQQWLAHPGTLALREAFHQRLRNLEVQQVDLGGPNNDREYLVSVNGGWREVRQIYEEIWGEPPPR